MKKNVMLAFLLFFIFHDVFAYVCRSKDGEEFPLSGDSVYTVRVPLDRTITPDKTVFFDMSQYFECMNQAPARFVDIMDLSKTGITTMLPDDFATGAVINGITYPRLPVPAGTRVFRLTDDNWHDVGIQVYYKLKKYPGKLVKIKAGDTIAVVQLHKYSEPPESVSDFTWTLKADNDSIYTAGTCEINHGNDIDIDFGSVPNWQLSSSSESSLLRRRVEVPYNCENPITMPVSITLSASSPVFSSDVIKLSDPALGVQMLYKGQAIKPGDSIQTSLVQGVGSDTFEFVLVKKEHAKIKPGPFTGSAVLVMSVV